MRTKVSFNSFLHFVGIGLVILFFSGEIKGQVLESPKKENITSSALSPMYLLTYDHGGLVLWGTDHFAKYLRSAITWLDRYPDFKIGLDNEAYTYDFLIPRNTVCTPPSSVYVMMDAGEKGLQVRRFAKQ
jgi:hypothetical protein